MDGRLIIDSAPPPSDRRAVLAALLLAALAAGFIVYGSLYPALREQFGTIGQLVE